MFLTTAFRRLCSLQHRAPVMFPSLLARVLSPFLGSSPLHSALCFRGRWVSTPEGFEGKFGTGKTWQCSSCMAGMLCYPSFGARLGEQLLGQGGWIRGAGAKLRVEWNGNVVTGGMLGLGNKTRCVCPFTRCVCP